MTQRDKTNLKCILNEVAINFNLFGVFMEHRIVGIMKPNLIITMQENRGERLRCEGHGVSEKVISIHTKSWLVILSFSRRTRDNVLFLCFPRD